MAQTCSKSLYEVFGEVPDPRNALGKQHPLAALLTLATVAMLCGSRGLSAISQWGRDHEELAGQLGFTRRKNNRNKQLKLPCTSTFHYLFKAIDIQAFESALTNWMTSGEQDNAQQRVLNFDGKTFSLSKTTSQP